MLSVDLFRMLNTMLKAYLRPKQALQRLPSLRRGCLLSWLSHPGLARDRLPDPAQPCHCVPQ